MSFTCVWSLLVYVWIDPQMIPLSTKAEARQHGWNRPTKSATASAQRSQCNKKRWRTRLSVMDMLLMFIIEDVDVDVVCCFAVCCWSFCCRCICRGQMMLFLNIFFYRTYSESHLGGGYKDLFGEFFTKPWRVKTTSRAVSTWMLILWGRMLSPHLWGVQKDL